MRVAVRLAWALILISLAACRPAKVCTPLGPSPCRDEAPARPEPLAHAHNDYEHPRPLEDALAQGFRSVEVDIYERDGALQVSHDGIFFKGSLQRLYLDPLQQRVDARGSVHGDGLPFYLWIDFKEDHPGIVSALHQTLASMSMVRRHGEGGDDKPVVVMLTGRAKAKEAFVERSPQLGVRDSNVLDASDPDADGKWVAYALKYGDYFSWDGRGAMPEDERATLECLVGRAHQRGRVLRLYAGPDTEPYWAASYQAGVDFLHTDKLAQLRQFLSGPARELTRQEQACRR